MSSALGQIMKYFYAKHIWAQNELRKENYGWRIVTFRAFTSMTERQKWLDEKPLEDEESRLPLTRRALLADDFFRRDPTAVITKFDGQKWDGCYFYVREKRKPPRRPLQK